MTRTTPDEYAVTAQYCQTPEGDGGGLTHEFLFPALVYPDEASVMVHVRAYVDNMAPGEASYG
ncbi:hypothetical protein ACFSC4_31500 [Deinococcus malanensis]|uniref:hypothetical protein n=1 Tax=Deinococcus malanensis TaxID=1706855 RepID=UPI003638E729